MYRGEKFAFAIADIAFGRREIGIVQHDTMAQQYCEKQ